MNQPITTLRDIIRAFANAMNLIDREVQDHHEKVACFSMWMADAMNLSEEEKKLTFYGALLHDVGSVMMEKNISLMELEMKPHELARAGAALLRWSPTTSFLSDIVGKSQSPWQRLRALGQRVGKPVLIGQIIHLSDLVSLMLTEEKPVLNQVADIQARIHAAGEKEFHPDVVSAFDQVCGREGVWLDATYRPESFLDFIPVNRLLTLDDVAKLTEFMAHLIDFRSPFTAMHSAGVSATAEMLARLCGMSEEECRMMAIAGHLHDVGKLKIPKAILEKPGKLTDEEFNVMKEHAYYTFILLKDISGFEQITAWAAFHHEKLNGAGYPYHLTADQIPLGSRIMAVADVFSAITEDRPYRRGMEKEKSIAVLRGDAEKGALSSAIVDVLIGHFDEINDARRQKADAASKRYRESRESVSNS